MIAPPTIQIRLQGMEQTIQQAFLAYQDDVSAEVSRLLAEEVANFNFNEVVRQRARELLTAAVKGSMESFFRYGDGYKAIDAAIQAAMKNVLVEQSEEK